VLTPRIRSALVILAASAGLGACTSFSPYGGIGVGVGSGYGSYGYDPYYGGYGRGSPYGYYGWYDGFYYPGAGYWIYDRYGHHHPITERQSDYWRNKLAKFREARGAQATAEVKENWSGFSKQGKVSAPVAASGSAQADQRSLRQISEARRQAAQTERQQARSERQQARSERQESVRQQVQERRESRRASKPTDD
jgi:hypothetical protein